LRATNRDIFGWGSRTEVERRRRIRLSVWAYAYEIANAPLVDDARFDAEAYASNPQIFTGRLDIWWMQHFRPFTGQWINWHPELPRVALLYTRYAERAAVSNGTIHYGVAVVSGR
jgi:hypothetical protein